MTMTVPADRALTRAMAKAVARAWRDPEFAELLRSDPDAALQELGGDVPEDVTLVVHDENQPVFQLPSPDDPNASAALAQAAQAALAELNRAAAVATPSTGSAGRSPSPQP